MCQPKFYWLRPKLWYQEGGSLRHVESVCPPGVARSSSPELTLEGHTHSHSSRGSLGKDTSNESWGHLNGQTSASLTERSVGQLSPVSRSGHPVLWAVSLGYHPSNHLRSSPVALPTQHLLPLPLVRAAQLSLRDNSQPQVQVWGQPAYFHPAPTHSCHRDCGGQASLLDLVSRESNMDF